MASSKTAAQATDYVVENASAMVAGPIGERVSRELPDSVARACAGDARELERIARRELPKVQRLLRRILGPRNDMEDLVQVVFLEMCRALPGFRGESTVSTFVGGITVRVAKRAMRPAAWFRLRGPMPEQPVISADRPEENAVASEQLQRLDAALAKISKDKRIAFVLWAIEGNDVSTIAETTGASVAATRSRIYYAQKELKAFASGDPYLRELVEGSDAG